MRTCTQCKREGIKTPQPIAYQVRGRVDGKRVDGLVCKEHEKQLYKDSNEKLISFELDGRWA
jgi:hypothetical protein